MTENTHSFPTQTVKLVQTLEKLAKENGFDDLTAFLNDVFAIHKLVDDELETEGRVMKMQLVEALKLFRLAEEAAEKGRSLGEIEKFPDGRLGVYSSIVPSSLLEKYHEALRQRDASRPHPVAANLAPVT